MNPQHARAAQRGGTGRPARGSRPVASGQTGVGGAEIAQKWARYLAQRDHRSHRDLLQTVDGFIRAETRRMLVSHSHLAEEVAQEALVGVERKIATFEAPEYPAAYIRRVLSNRMATLLQRESRRQAREQRCWSPNDEISLDVADVASNIDWHDFLETLRQSVSDDEFWTLILHHHFEFSYDEIGELLDKQSGTVRQIALRGRRKACERMSRLEGRVPAWLALGFNGLDVHQLNSDATGSGGTGEIETGELESGGSEASGMGIRSEAGGFEAGEHDLTGVAARSERRQRPEDPVDGQRRPSTGSTVTSGTSNLWSRWGWPWERRWGRQWLLDSPCSVVPLVLLLAVPVLVQTREQPVAAAIRSAPPAGPSLPPAGPPEPSGPSPSTGPTPTPTVAGRASLPSSTATTTLPGAGTAITPTEAPTAGTELRATIRARGTTTPAPKLTSVTTAASTTETSAAATITSATTGIPLPTAAVSSSTTTTASTASVVATSIATTTAPAPSATATSVSATMTSVSATSTSGSTTSLAPRATSTATVTSTTTATSSAVSTSTTATASTTSTTSTTVSTTARSTTSSPSTTAPPRGSTTTEPGVEPPPNL